MIEKWGGDGFFELSLAAFFVTFMDLKDCTRQWTYFWFAQQDSSMIFFSPSVFLLHVWTFWIVNLADDISHKGDLLLKLMQFFLNVS